MKKKKKPRIRQYKVTFRLSEKEVTQLRGEAEFRELTISEYCRGILAAVAIMPREKKARA